MHILLDPVWPLADCCEGQLWVEAV